MMDDMNKHGDMLKEGNNFKVLTGEARKTRKDYELKDYRKRQKQIEKKKKQIERKRQRQLKKKEKLNDK